MSLETQPASTERKSEGTLIFSGIERYPISTEVQNFIKKGFCKPDLNAMLLQIQRLLQN